MKVKVTGVTFDEMSKTGLSPDKVYEVIKDLGAKYIIQDNNGVIHNIDKNRTKEVT